MRDLSPDHRATANGRCVQAQPAPDRVSQAEPLLRPDNRLEYRMGQFLDIAPGGGRLRIGAVC